ncbi:glycosyltransferase family 2 protein [Flavobacterium sp. MAH-1]|uniref:Glycosyltransferase family 2 protein n=1 Tax=Flavobacterium agri TaxID=2743471 RepID=A0A7Y8Y282_9FLAO|nr:glycosyltransferase family A protein [Flavobacterium agri]NUY81225.1 glycosyltransferase family 2 protein [Flavobacterium agri]NYA71249.1 glycosyltransferase family 2 protein [Flavobacterium agri]
MKISVVIPLFNKGRHIKKTLQSALAQTFEDFELIVVNDGSTDESESEVLALTDARIRYFKTENQGVSAARNFGISKSQGELIAFLDADDWWKPWHLQKLSELFSDFGQAGLFCMNYVRSYSETKNRVPKFIGLPEEFPWRGIVPDFFHSSYIDRIAWTSAVAVPKKILDEIGNFDENITLGAGEDLDLWIRIALKYPVAFDSEYSAYHNLSADNRMSLTQTGHRSFALLDQFSREEKNNKSLKRFLDLYRAEFALKMKLASDKRYDFYKRNIDSKNLCAKTRLLLALPGFALRPIYRFKKFLESKDVEVSAYH